MQTLGVVLCGGKSSRMGTDKGLLKTDNCTWAEIAFRKLNSLSIPSVVSVNASQKELYLKMFPEEMLVVDQPTVEGPLNGLVSIHKKFPDKNLFVLACDLVDIKREVLVNLYNAYLSERKLYEYFVYRNKNFYEPLCGIYTCPGLANVLLEIEKNTLKTFSMKNILLNGKTYSKEIDKEIESQFLNYNEPHLLNKETPIF